MVRTKQSSKQIKKSKQKKNKGALFVRSSHVQPPFSRRARVSASSLSDGTPASHDSEQLTVHGSQMQSNLFDEGMIEIQPINPFPEANLCNLSHCHIMLDFGNNERMLLCRHQLMQHLQWFNQHLQNNNNHLYKMPTHIHAGRFRQLLRSLYKPVTAESHLLMPDPLPNHPKELVEIIQMAVEFGCRNYFYDVMVSKLNEGVLWEADSQYKLQLFNYAFTHKQQYPQLMLASMKISLGINVEELMSIGCQSDDIILDKLIFKICKIQLSEGPFTWEQIVKFDGNYFE